MTEKTEEEEINGNHMVNKLLPTGMPRKEQQQNESLVSVTYCFESLIAISYNAHCPVAPFPTIQIVQDWEAMAPLAPLWLCH